MSTLTEILKAKQGRLIHRVSQAQTVLEAVCLMNEHGIGALIVEDSGKVVGIFTERDILRRVVAAGKSPGGTRVAEVMTAQVICCTPETSVDEVRRLMRDRRIRHVPVVNESGEIVGLISIGDLNAFLTNSQESTIHYLNEYLHGRV